MSTKDKKLIIHELLKIQEDFITAYKYHLDVNEINELDAIKRIENIINFLELDSGMGFSRPSNICYNMSELLVGLFSNDR